jgi:hypothetical protein
MKKAPTIIISRTRTYVRILEHLSPKAARRRKKMSGSVWEIQQKVKTSTQCHVAVEVRGHLGLSGTEVVRDLATTDRGAP